MFVKRQDFEDGDDVEETSRGRALAKSEGHAKGWQLVVSV
jgi:hypothetical protein